MGKAGLKCRSLRTARADSVTIIRLAHGSPERCAADPERWRAAARELRIRRPGQRHLAKCAPLVLAQGANTSHFAYGPDHQRTKQIRSDGTTIWYAGGIEVESSASQNRVKTYWPAGLGLEIDIGGPPTQLWMHKDRLGSVVALSDATGALVAEDGFDAWGLRRNPNASPVVWDNKGFTGQEMLDQLTLVHLNGRVYDPFVARFISADPHVTDPAHGQNYNRYSYVLNNPSNLTDPSGFSECPSTQVCPPPPPPPRPPPPPPDKKDRLHEAEGWKTVWINPDVAQEKADRAAASQARTTSAGTLQGSGKNPTGDFSSMQLAQTATYNQIGDVTMVDSLGLPYGPRPPENPVYLGDPLAEFMNQHEAGNPRYWGPAASQSAALSVSVVLSMTPVSEALGASLAARGIPELPAFVNGGKTLGVLRTAAGDTPLQSGWAGPASGIPKGDLWLRHSDAHARRRARGGTYATRRNIGRHALHKQPDNLFELLELASPHVAFWSATECRDAEWLDRFYRSGTVRAMFFDRQDAANPLNGIAVDSAEALRSIVHDMQRRPPFLSELIGTNGRKLLLGLGSADGCVQFSSTDGAPPYLMALQKGPKPEEGEQNFLMGDTPTPVPRRYCLPMETVTEIAAVFLESGELASNVEWEEI
jgi:RHS repeat-associated protein